MMGDRFGLGVCVAQRVGRPAMQRLAAALEQAFVSRVLYQRVFETVSGGRGGAVDEQEVGFHESIQRGL